MTTVKAIEDKLVKQQNTNANTYMAPSKNMTNWYKDELLFVRRVENNEVVVFRSMDGKIYHLNDNHLLDFKLL